MLIIVWFLEIKKIGANIKHSLSVFDRDEGGVQKINQLGVKHYSIFKYDQDTEELHAHIQELPCRYLTYPNKIFSTHLQWEHH